MQFFDDELDALLSSVKNSKVYLEYRRQEEKIMKEPELKKQIDAFRERNFRMHNTGSPEKILEISQQIYRESTELRKNSDVNAYLDAELALCKTLQIIFDRILEEIDIQIPEI